MGSTLFGGGLLQRSYKLNQINYPKQILLYLTNNYKMLQGLQQLQDIQGMYKSNTIYTNVSVQSLPSMPQ